MRILVALGVSLVAAASSAQVSTAVETSQVQSRLSSVKACWERAVREGPTPSKAILAIDVDPEGTVTRVTVDPLPERLAACIANRVRTWKFQSGAVRQLSYPILLIAAE